MMLFTVNNIIQHVNLWLHSITYLSFLSHYSSIHIFVTCQAKGTISELCKTLYAQDQNKLHNYPTLSTKVSSNIISTLKEHVAPKSHTHKKNYITQQSCL